MDATPNPTIYWPMEGAVNEAPDMSAFREPWESEPYTSQRSNIRDPSNVALVRGKKRQANEAWPTYREQGTWQRTKAIGSSVFILETRFRRIGLRSMTAGLARDTEEEEQISRLLRMFHITEPNVHVRHRAQHLIHRSLTTLFPGDCDSANQATCRDRTLFGWEQ